MPVGMIEEGHPVFESTDVGDVDESVAITSREHIEYHGTTVLKTSVAIGRAKKALFVESCVWTMAFGKIRRIALGVGWSQRRGQASYPDLNLVHESPFHVSAEMCSYSHELFCSPPAIQLLLIPSQGVQ